MLRVIGFGDNVVDRYLDLGQMFPGGNAVNFAALARKYGFESAYLGVVGDDAEGDLLKEALQEENVDISRLQTVGKKTAFTDVALEEGERVFKDSDLSIYKELTLAKDDLEYIGEYDLLHTSVYSETNHHLPTIRKKVKHLSFDFSDKWDQDIMEEVAPFVDFAFLSGSDKTDEEVEERLKDLTAHGVEVAAITRGAEGAILFDGKSFYRQGIVPVDVVDTLGAGDAFLTMFLVNYLMSSEVAYAMKLAAEAAAASCTHYGAFGHGVPFA